MNGYGAAGYVALWITAVGGSVYLVLTIMVVLEIRKFERWSEQRFRKHTQHHIEAMRWLDQATGQACDGFTSGENSRPRAEPSDGA